MKKSIQALFLGFIIASFISTFSACTSREFIPLYQDTEKQLETARLIAPIEIDLIYHNGKQKTLNPPYKPLVNYRLLPGKHLLGFRYQDVHFDEDENQEIISSNVVLIRFTAQAGKIYQIDFNKPDSYFMAKQLEENFQLSLSQNKQFITSSTPAPEKIEDDSFFSSNDVELSTSEDKPAPAIEHLKFWWLNASQEEKDVFTDWVKEN